MSDDTAARSSVEWIGERAEAENGGLRLLLARTEGLLADAEAEVERLRLLLTESMFFVGYAEQAGATRAQLFREQVAAALTPHNEGDPAAAPEGPMSEEGR